MSFVFPVDISRRSSRPRDAGRHVVVGELVGERRALEERRDLEAEEVAELPDDEHFVADEDLHEELRERGRDGRELEEGQGAQLTG